METGIRTFGDKEPGVEYELRPGGYLIVLNEAGLVGVVRTRKGYYLPGGGVEDGETAEDAAVREAREECAMSVDRVRHVVTADELVFVAEEEKHYRKRGTFFLADLVSVNGEGDHELVWLAAEEASFGLKHESQRWAVKQALKK